MQSHPSGMSNLYLSAISSEAFFCWRSVPCLVCLPSIFLFCRLCCLSVPHMSAVTSVSFVCTLHLSALSSVSSFCSLSVCCFSYLVLLLSTALSSVCSFCPPSVLVFFFHFTCMPFIFWHVHLCHVFLTLIPLRYYTPVSYVHPASFSAVSLSSFWLILCLESSENM